MNILLASFVFSLAVYAGEGQIFEQESVDAYTEICLFYNLRDITIELNDDGLPVAIICLPTEDETGTPS